MFSFELLLMLGALGFYLYDSGMILFINELFFVKKKNGWCFIYPEANFQFLGKILYIPNPFLPERVIFRVCWSESDKGEDYDKNSLEHLIKAINPIRYMIATLFVLFFMALPLVLYLYGSGSQLLWVFGFIYLNITVILVHIYKKKSALGISNMKFLSLSFESLACAPFALNILRKLTLNHGLSDETIEFARKKFKQECFHRFIGAVENRINEQLDCLESSAPRYLKLQSYKTKINGMK